LDHRIQCVLHHFVFLRERRLSGFVFGRQVSSMAYQNEASVKWPSALAK
jgi:hypothetical protein